MFGLEPSHNQLSIILAMKFEKYKLLLLTVDCSVLLEQYFTYQAITTISLEFFISSTQEAAMYYRSIFSTLV